PLTSACPPSLPSLPTSRATRVTSLANEPSWSTIVLIVFLSSRISPLTSTVIFLDRSPRATAVVTSAILRSWSVGLAAIELTMSFLAAHAEAAALRAGPECPAALVHRYPRPPSDAIRRGEGGAWARLLAPVGCANAVRRRRPTEGGLQAG